ncbi:MAG TPA: TlpA disulfide reductase family protein [Planctomycetaceae bacterium]|nr:TlpA disulfide reductase family protein [Planctomycetaceae bacterium]
MQRYLSCLTCFMLLLSGCNDQAQQTSNRTEPVGSAKPEFATPADPGSSVPTEDPDWAKETPEPSEEKNSPPEDSPVEITLETVDESGYAAKLAELQEKVVLVDFWATWCIPCRKSFPHTVELAHLHAEEGLAVISVALDEEIVVGEIHKFLEQHRADLINLRSIYGAEDSSFERFDLGTTGLPHYKLYARDGTVVKTFTVPEDGTAIDTDEIARAVKAELAK